MAAIFADRLRKGRNGRLAAPSGLPAPFDPRDPPDPLDRFDMFDLLDPTLSLDIEDALTARELSVRVFDDARVVLLQILRTHG